MRAFFIRLLREKKIDDNIFSRVKLVQKLVFENGEE